MGVPVTAALLYLLSHSSRCLPNIEHKFNSLFGVILISDWLREGYLPNYNV
jgi:hypothetical protein